MKKIEKMKNRKNDFKWYSFNIEIPGVPLTNTIINYLVKSFFEQKVSTFDNTFFAAILKVEFKKISETGKIFTIFRSISRLQMLNNKLSSEILSDIFQSYWDICDEQYHLINVLKVSIIYKFLPGIKKDKLLSPKNKEVLKFTFKGYSLPTTIDLYEWGDVTLNKDCTKALILLNNKRTYFNVVLYDSYIEVKVCSIITEKILFNFTDFMLDRDNLSTFKRIIGKQTYIFKDGIKKLVSVVRIVKFIDKIKTSINRTNNFITIDLETRTINGEMSIVCLSIFDGINLYSFYLIDYKSVEEMIKIAFKLLIKRKYYNYHVYFHNFSYFDGVFLLKILATLGKIKLIIRDNRIISIRFKFKEDNKAILYIYDSYLILPKSQRELAESFNVEVKKGYFPYKFINNENISLNYKGEIPAFEYFDNLSFLDYKNYVNTREHLLVWDLKLELIKYCEQDVISLYQIIDKFSKEIFDIFNLDLIKYPTLPSLSFAIYRSNYIKNKNIPIISGEMFYDIFNSYYGGLVDMYKPYGKNLYHYDVNSLYPYAIINPIPVGIPIYFEGKINIFNKDSFGFFYCKVNAPNNLNIPVLPTKIDGKTICGVGIWEGWYFSEELKDSIVNYGYKIEVLKGYLFKKDVLFVNFVNTLYTIKQNSRKGDPRYVISKLLLNILYGRFGISPFIETVEIVKNKEAYKYYDKYEVSEIIDLQNGIEFIKFLKNKDQMDDNIISPNISIAIASAIVSYARIEINKYKHLPGYELYYSDTDSVVLNKPLTQELVGKNLGQIKLEYIIISGIYLIAKGYGVLTNDVKELIIVKIKGLKNPISFFKLMPLLYIENQINEYQEKWYRNWEQGSILIQNEIYTLTVTINKRLLIYDCCQKLINTKPFILENGKIINKNVLNNILYYLIPPNQLYLPKLNQLYLPKLK